MQATRRGVLGMIGMGLAGASPAPPSLGIFQPFGGFADGLAVADSLVSLPDIPGIGFEAKADLCRMMRALAAWFQFFSCLR
jgi:hypothetical protein